MILEEAFKKLADKYDIELKPSLREHLLFGLPTTSELREYAGTHQFQLSYATPKDIFSYFLMAQLVNSLVLPFEAVDGVNKKLQELVEKLLCETSDDIQCINAYRAVLVFNK